MSIKITEEGKTLLEDAILQDKKVVFSQIELIADVEKSPTEMVKRVDVSKVSASDYNTITVQAQIDNDGFLDTYYFNRANVYADEVLFAYDDGINICIPAETTKVINDLEMMMKIDSAAADLKIIYEGYVLRKDFDDMESKIQKINTTIKDMEANAVTQNDCTDQVSWNSQIVKKEFLTIGNMAFFRATGGFSTSRGSIVLATIPQGYFPETTRNQSSYELMGVFTSAYDKERRNCYVTLNCLSGNVDLQINNNEAYSDTRADDNVQMIFYGFWKMHTESQGGTGGSISYREDIEKLRQSIQDSKKEIVKSGREIDSLKGDLTKKINYKKIDNELRKSFYSIVNEFLICDGTLKDEYSKSGFENNNIVSTLSGYGSNVGGFVYTGNFTYDVGDEIYVSAKLTANGGRINKLLFFGLGLSTIDTDGIYYAEKVISPKTLTNNDIYVKVSFEDAKNKKIILSDIIIVNLTKTFRKGSEPSIEEFKNIISVSNGLINDGIINLFDAKKANERLLKIDNFEKKDVLVENLALRNGTEKNQGVIKNTSSNVYFEKYSLPETASQGDVVYSCATFKYDNDTCTKILVKYDSNTGETASPIPQNEWFTLSSLGFVQDGKNRINCGYYFYFDDNTTNKTVEFTDFIILNLTTIFGKGNEPSKETIDKLLSVYENRCFDGVFGSIFNGNLAFVTPRNIQGINGNCVKTNNDGNIVLSSVPNYNWSGWKEIGNYGQENKGSIPIYNKVHGTLETDGMLSVLPIWGCWSENSAAKGTGSKYHGGHVFHGWTTDRKHRLTMLQNMYRDDEAALFNYIPGDKANNGEGTFLRLRLGADNIGKGVLIVPVLDSNNHYAYTRHVVFGRLNIQSDRSKYDVNGNGESAYTKGLPVNTIPSSSTADGVKGDFTFDSNYAYFCVDDNKWKRIPLEEW